MAFLDWKDKMSVGNDALDADHKKLLGFLNDLHDRMDGNPDPEAILRILDRLVDFANYHFEFEEKILRLVKYPELPRHHEKHKELFAQLLEQREGYRKGPSDYRLVGIFDFLSAWLMKHILREDMAYKPHMEKIPAKPKKAAPPPEPSAEPAVAEEKTEWADIPESTKAPSVEWTDEMSVGVPAIDTNHRKFIGFLNEAQAFVTGARKREDLGRFLKQVHDFSSYHFALEEKLLYFGRYPDLEEHRALHREIVGQLEKFMETQARNPEAFSAMTIFDFLSVWLMKHILKEDMEYKPFLQKK